MNPIRFLETRRECVFLSPADFRPETHLVQYRRDPLTGVRCRLNEKRVARPKQVPGGHSAEELSRKPSNCPFCPENIEAATPRFAPEICKQGYHEAGECRLFPNLFPLAPWHANITLTQRHFLSVEQFTATMLEDAWRTAQAFLRDVQRAARGKLFPIICWNHLPPSGGSIVHPHMQVLLDRNPTFYQKKLLDASKAFYRRTGASYWPELVRAEKEKGERFVGENGSLWVLASYAPQGNREFQLIFKDAVSLADLDEKTTSHFARAVVKVLAYYHACGVESFNLTTLSPALGERLPFYNLSAKIIARPAVQPLYRNDTGVLERLHYEADVEIAPEALAKEAREFFDSEGG